MVTHAIQLSPLYLPILFFALLLLASTANGDLAPEEKKAAFERLSRDHQKMSEATVRGDISEENRIRTEMIDYLGDYGTDHSIATLLINLLHNRSSLSATVGDFDGAESDLLQALRIAKELHLPHNGGEREREMYRTYRGLAELYLAAGNLKRAYQGYDAAKYFKRDSHKKRREAIIRNAASTNWSDAALQKALAEFTGGGMGSEWSEGNFLKRLGDYEKAEAHLQSELRDAEEYWALREVNLREVSNWVSIASTYHKNRALILIDLAELSIRGGNTEEARAFCQRAVEVAEEAIEINLANPTGIAPFDMEKMKQLGLAPEVLEKMQRSAEEEMEKLSKITSIGTKYDLNFFYYLKHVRIAELFFSTGDAVTASALLDEGLTKPEITGMTSNARSLLFPGWSINPERAYGLQGDISASLGNLEKAEEAYVKSLEIARTAFPEDNPTVLQAREKIAFLRAMNDPDPESHSQMEPIIDAYLKNLFKVLSFGDEGQRLSYRAIFDPWSYYASFNLADQLADTVIQTKGVVFESILEDRRRLRLASLSGNSDQVRKLRILRRSLMETLMSGDAGSDEQSDRIRRDIQALEEELGGKSQKSGSESAKALQLSYRDITSVLPDDSIIFDFIRYKNFTSPAVSTTEYGFLVLRKDAKPVFMNLGDANRIDQMIEEYATLCREGSDIDLEHSVRELSKLILTPLEEFLGPKTENVFLSPDGSLSFLSFGSLITSNDRFLIEDHKLSYLANSRSLLKEAEKEPIKEMVFFADPEFDEKVETGSPSLEVSGGTVLALRGGLQGIELPPLPGTESEMETIESVLIDEWKWEVRTYTGIEASEKRLSTIDSPGILHLATHGFFLPDTSSRNETSYEHAGNSDDTISLNNPMHRSGLALAGANITLGEWDEGIVNDTSVDGIISATELGDLKLQNTWLVVLSACDTGIGKVISGEGVLGIRHGLIQAGADNLLLTLWPVADLETVEFMTNFYHALDFGNVSPTTALAHAQKKMLLKFREEHGIGRAIRIAGPFVLNQ